MYPLAHAGFAVAAGTLARHRVALPPRALLWLAVGGLLPDLLDKPLGFWVLHLNEGRLIGHTVLFAATLLLAGFAWQRSWVAPIALVGWGCFSHLLLDLPLAGTALWPFLGFEFPIRDYTITLSFYEDLLQKPAILVGEAAGALVLGWTMLSQRRDPRHPWSTLRHGRAPGKP